MKIRYNSPVVLTHAGWSHFKGNLIMILLIGPLLEEKYGSWLIFEMMVITAAATALINAAIFHHPCGGQRSCVYLERPLAHRCLQSHSSD